MDFGLQGCSYVNTYSPPAMLQEREQEEMEGGDAPIEASKVTL